MNFPWLSVTATYAAVGVACYAAIRGNALAFAGWLGIAFVITVCIVHHQLHPHQEQAP
jgi:hypothetical protein